jgi:5-(carboxyamino)imidazole ribonucleotide mutase
MSADVVIVMGSPRDWPVMALAGEELTRLGVTWRAHVSSAHRSLDRTVALIRDAEATGTRVFICGAGMAAHLAGVVAGCTTRPVIGVPLPGGLQDGLDALLSTVQMPGGIPVATVAVGKAGARNAAILATEILATSNPDLHERLRQDRVAQAQAVAEADRGLTGPDGVS